MVSTNTADMYLFKGSVSSWSDLPTDANTGDIYHVTDIGSDVVFSENWIPLDSSRSDTIVFRDIADFINHRQMFRTTCRCCGGLMPHTAEKLNTCIYCGAVQNTFEQVRNLT